MNKELYYKDSLETDIQWLQGYGIDADEAKQFIKNIFESTPSVEVQQILNGGTK